MELPLLSESMDIEDHAVSPFREMGAYEALWLDPKTTFKSLSQKFAQHPGSLPSCFVGRKEAHECAEFVTQRFEEAKIGRARLRRRRVSREAARCRLPYRTALLSGMVGLGKFAFCCRCRHSESLKHRACPHRTDHALVANDFTVVSGLAAGTDRMA